MKKIMILVTMLMMPLMACSAEYQEGEHYTKISDKPSRKPELREYFSFYCGHCFNFEGMAQEVKKGLPPEMSFELNHVDFLGGASKKVQGLLTKAVVVAQQLKQEKALVSAIFKYVQVDRRVFTSQNDIRKLFVANGVDGAKFDKLMSSFSVNGQAKKLKKHQDDLNKQGVLTGVPTFVVNGQYIIKRGALDKKDPVKDFQNLVKYLQTL